MVSLTDSDSTSDKVLSDLNRLSGASSPYLRQHALQPVAWQPWDEEALLKAQLEDKPIFLSIGYAACHWCHVMAHESFDNPEIASLMNRFFVNIKVDREERPDLDDLYMSAVVALTGRGGWPASIFLTPDLEPFYAGTYFPPTSRYGIPGFSQILEEIARLWRSDRSRIQTQAAALTDRLKHHFTVVPASHMVEPETLVDQALAVLAATFDSQWGGWGDAPKFPSHAAVALLLRNGKRREIPHYLHMAEKTLECMAAGGIHDHLGGGFHRYSVDAQWQVPHFEKMLYDNAHLVLSYLEAWQSTAKEKHRHITESILNYVLRDLTSPEGAFYSSEDADSEGLEGKFYLWSYEELQKGLSAEHLAFLKKHFSVSEKGNFESHEPGHEGLNILSAKAWIIGEPWDTIRKILLEKRSRRIRPGLDTKVIASWNGLMITALAKAAFYLKNDVYRDAGEKAGHFVETHLLSDEGLFRIWSDGKASHPAYLEDYATVTNAFLDLYQCTFNRRWLALAKGTGERMIHLFLDKKNGGFFTTGEQHKHLFARMKTVHDAAEVSAASTAALGLMKLAWHFDEPAFENAALTVWQTGAPSAQNAVQGHLHLALFADTLHHGFTEATLRPGCTAADLEALLEVLRQEAPLNTLLKLERDPESSDDATAPPQTNQSTHSAVYLCLHRSCLPPISSAKELRRRLRNASAD